MYFILKLQKGGERGNDGSQSDSQKPLTESKSMNI